MLNPPIYLRMKTIIRRLVFRDGNLINLCNHIFDTIESNRACEIYLVKCIML